MDWVCATPGGLCGRQIQNDLAFDGIRWAVPLFTHGKKTAKANLVNPAVFSVALGFWGGRWMGEARPQEAYGVGQIRKT